MEVVPHVNVAEEGGAVVDVGVAVAPAYHRRGDSLRGKKVIISFVLEILNFEYSSFFLLHTKLERIYVRKHHCPKKYREAWIRLHNRPTWDGEDVQREADGEGEDKDKSSFACLRACSCIGHKAAVKSRRRRQTDLGEQQKGPFLPWDGERAVSTGVVWGWGEGGPTI